MTLTAYAEHSPVMESADYGLRTWLSCWCGYDERQDGGSWMAHLRPVDRHSLAQALPEHRYCTDHIRGHESCLAAADTILRNLEGGK